MKKIFISVLIAVAVFLLASVITFARLSCLPQPQGVDEINLYLESYGSDVFDKENIINITDKNEIEEIIKIMQSGKRNIILHKDAHELAFDPSGYIELVLNNEGVKRYVFFENKTGFYYKKSSDWFFYFTYKNNSFQILTDKYKN